MPFTHGRNSITQTVYFEKQKMQLYNKRSYVNGRAFHAASFGIFCLSNRAE
jgi:hypothetical protein